MTALIDLSPIAQLLLVGAVLATLALWPLWRRHREEAPAVKLRALTLVTLFLTFDLVMFGAFTRLTDSGLGCPDWPGCYGNASPAGAHAEISQAQATMPSGPVTHGKAWIEMIHRYLATAVGALITVAMVWRWRLSLSGLRRPGGDGGPSPAWATLTFLWVCAQGAFGALTVTMKLYPAIVTAHLLGGIGLLALLAVQYQQDGRAEAGPTAGTPAGPLAPPTAPRVEWPIQLPIGLHRAVWGLLALVLVQVALGGWVSTNYAVLACSDFPTCQGQWWPAATAADYASGFTLLRERGYQADGSGLGLAAMVAIHWTHRLGAAAVFVALAAVAAALWRQPDASARRHAQGLVAVALWQFASGLGNVVLGWPLWAAVAHTGGAAALVALLAGLLTRAARTSAAARRAAMPQPALHH
jgi:cytochrome c oxidase assembly protein subunit 15